ncbi:MAG TPA: hypothetical protein VJ757_06550 [Pseudonocardiaceae bacterium]|nr:hypothetical protein [Pseudonocardiaceae bacterium]
MAPGASGPAAATEGHGPDGSRIVPRPAQRDTRDTAAPSAALDTESPGLGTAVRLEAAVAIDAGCDVVVTTDRAFDGLGGLRRSDPLDTAAITAALLG